MGNDLSLTDVVEQLRRNEIENEIRICYSLGIEEDFFSDGKYNLTQIKQIRLGLEDDIDVSSYLNPEYTWFQMEEIRLGLKKGIDISIYVDDFD